MNRVLVLLSVFAFAFTSLRIAPAVSATGTPVLFTTNDGGFPYGEYRVPNISVYVDDVKIGYTGSDGDCIGIPVLVPGIHKVDYVWANGSDPSPETSYGQLTCSLLIPDQPSLFTVRIPTVQVKFCAQYGLNVCLNQVWLGCDLGSGLLANMMSGNYTVTYNLGYGRPIPPWPKMPPFPGTPDDSLKGFTELCVGSADPYPVPAAPVEIYLPKLETVNDAPVAEAGPEQIVEQTSPTGASVTLNGSGSTDPDNDPLTYSWTWSGGSATGISPTVILPPGKTSVALTVNDGDLSSSPDYVTITVADRTAPVPDMPNLSEISGACSVVITQFPTATDLCDGKISATTTSPREYTTQGTFVITWIYKDKAGNVATQTQAVKVQDKTPPLVSASGPVCVSVGKGNNKSNKITLITEDNCSKNPILQISKVEVFNNGGNRVNGNGIYEISGNTVYINPNGNGWTVKITAIATDENGNMVPVVITKTLIKC